MSQLRRFVSTLRHGARALVSRLGGGRERLQGTRSSNPTDRIFGQTYLDGLRPSGLAEHSGARRRHSNRGVSGVGGWLSLTVTGRWVVAGLILLVAAGLFAGNHIRIASSQPARIEAEAPARLPEIRTVHRPEIWPLNPPVSRNRFEFARLGASEVDPSSAARLVEWRSARGQPRSDPALSGDVAGGTVRIEYSLDEALTESVFEVLRRGRVARGHAIVIDPRSGRVLSYVSTDPDSFPPERAYPSASIVKVLTAAAMLQDEGERGLPSCVYRGNKYRLNRRRLDRPAAGRESNLEDAIATSNNQCFGQWALHDLGEEKLTQTFRKFGWLSEAAPGHDAGVMEAVETELDLGRLGSGLDGLRVTPMHVASLTSILTDGVWREPWWVDRVVDHAGRSLAPAEKRAPRQVLSLAEAESLRSMMVSTTTRGTAKSAFRKKRGGALLGEIRVAGKTGNLTGRDPDGRYEWFVGLAPAENPTVGVVILQLQSNRWWARSSELAARVLQEVFCEGSQCEVAFASRFTGELAPRAGPLLISDLDRPDRILSTD